MKRILTAIILLCATSAHAEWYLSGDLLQARYQGPQVDGTWQQEAMVARNGYPAIKQTKESLAWDVGVGYRFPDGTPWLMKNVSLEGGYKHFGALSAGGLAVDDRNYPTVRLEGPGVIDRECLRVYQYEATDHLQGGYLRLAKGVPIGYGLEPYVMAGAFVAYHDLDFWFRYGNRTITGGFTGLVAGPTAGGGVKLDIGKGIKARVSVESHWSLAESGHPISSQWLTVGGGIEVPLSLGSGTVRDYLWQRN